VIRSVRNSLIGMCVLTICMAQSAWSQPAPAEPGATAGPVVDPDQAEAQPSADSKTPTQPVQPDAQPAAAKPASALPWSGQTDVKGTGSLPSFLEVQDKRMKDERKPPTAAQLAALREMEAEVARFSKIGDAYRASILSVVQRDYQRQRRTRDEAFAKQIHVEERLEDKARQKAIVLFERFIAQYPDDPRYTPDAMFRLGELYFERSALAFQAQLDQVTLERDRRRESGQDSEELQDPDKNFSDTIELYKRLIETFPDYERIAGVYYLIGYCLNEEGNFEAARIAWLSLVCGNRFDYRRDSPKASDGEKEDGELQKHPALGLQSAPAAGPLRDPYAECKPVVESSDFYTETWLRVGEYHFDFDYRNDALDHAISAYGKILKHPQDRVYNLALYKLAWSYYRASRYPESIRHFAMLVQWSDDEKKRTGKAGTELRAEAIQYLGIAFAYDDWNENQILDPDEGLPTGLDRIQMPSMLPQDREWTPEVYFQLGSIYFDEAKYPQAVATWELALKRFPNHHRAPEIQNQIALAHVQNNQLDQALLARAKLGELYREGTAWWNANMDHPKEQRAAEQLAQDALIGAAVQHHQHAQNLRRRCVQDELPELCREAQLAYASAADAYRLYIEKNPNSPQAYELHYNWAEALYWSERYEQAAEAYAAVRDSNLDDKHLSEAARRVVESLKRLLDREVEANRLTVRTEPPAPQGTPPRAVAVEMPVLLQRLAQAREIYLARVDEAHDTESVRDSYEYNNALLLYLYGYWPHARDRFTRIFDQNCTGASADETGRVAWFNLNNMAVALNQTDEVERLSKDLQKRRCTFSAGAIAGAAVDCTRAENAEEPQCVATVQLSNIRYQKAVQIFEKAEKASGKDQGGLYRRGCNDVDRGRERRTHPSSGAARLRKSGRRVGAHQSLRVCGSFVCKDHRRSGTASGQGRGAAEAARCHPFQRLFPSSIQRKSFL
jgi:TolA-binding protein